MMARALEIIGERWSLLVVRELLLGPRRFTDLVRSLPEITPTRLTTRLRELDAAGVLTREPPSRGREVWDRLTEAGLELVPVVEALTLWGNDHAFEPPRAGEPLSPAAVMIGTKIALNRHGSHFRRPPLWVWLFPADDAYTLRYEDGAWTLARGNVEGADVIVDTTLEAWARFLCAPDRRKLPRSNIRLQGKAAAVKEFARAFSAELP